MDVFGMSVSGRSVGTMVLDFSRLVEDEMTGCSVVCIADVEMVVGAVAAADVETDSWALAAHNDSEYPSSGSEDS
jgi:hypothetical protein